MDMVEAGWHVVQPMLELWAADTRTPIPAYQPATWGPPESDLLIEREGRQWQP
jgi:glucose-6-phosphate 1-dehydrogenase